MARHAGRLPFTVQYIGTPPFLYQLQQTSVWGLGLLLGVVSWLSVPFTAAHALLRRNTRRADLLLLAWVVPTFVFLESFEVRFLRYAFPLMPFLILMGARMLLWLVELFRSAARSSPPTVAAVRPADYRPSPAYRRCLPWLPVGLVVLVVGATAFYALAFERVYTRDHPAVTASRWINENVPSGTSIVSDNHWDEFIPNLYQYNVWQFPVYEADTQEKMDTLAQHLSSAEYLVFYSHLPYSSVARAPERFPFSIQYYQQLFDGSLGYRLDRAFTSYPQLLGVAFRDDPFGRAGLRRPEPEAGGRSPPLAINLGYADDNAVGYDHPQVLLFRNVEHLPEDTLQVLLSGPAIPATGLMLSAEDKAVQQGGGTWSSIVHRDSWTNRFPVLAWLLVVELVLPRVAALGPVHISPAARSRDCPGPGAGPARGELCGLAHSQPRLDRLLQGCTAYWGAGNRRFIDGGSPGPLDRGHVVCEATLAAAADGRGVVSGGFPGFRGPARRQP